MTDHHASAASASSVDGETVLRDANFDYDFVAREVQRNLDRIVSDLESLARDVSRVRLSVQHREQPGFGDAAADVVALIMNAMPNLGLQALQYAAHQADTTLLLRRIERLSKTGSVSPVENPS